MEPMVRAVQEMLPDLEFQQFRDPDHRSKWVEIHRLARAQVRDALQGWAARREHVGGEDVSLRYNIWEGADLLYPPVTPDQRALEEGLQPLLQSALTGEQLVLVRWRYAARYTEREMAELLGISHQAVHSRIETIHRRLRETLLAAFGPRGLLTEEVAE